MNRNVDIVVFDNDEQSAARRKAIFEKAGLRFFRVAYLPSRRLIREPGFDALYWTLRAAERWGVCPVEDVIQIVRTNEIDRNEGWPDYLLVGLALSPANAKSMGCELRAWARAMLIALTGESAAAISRVKVPMDMTVFEQLTPTRAAAILADAERVLA